MPEGDAVHRLAAAFERLFVGSECHCWSPQGRFAHGAALLSGRTMAAATAHGKHLFLAFDDAAGERLWLHVHLGLYGAWRFHSAAPVEDLPHAIGAPRSSGVVDVAREHLALSFIDEAGAGGPGTPAAEWIPPAPIGQVRLRIEAPGIVADLTGPNQCEVLDDGERVGVLSRLGPDPLAPGAAEDAVACEHFVGSVRQRKRVIAELVMDQSIVAGVGNIYRAEGLYLCRINPHRRGNRVSEKRLRQLWAEFCRLMARGLQIGRIVTVNPEDAPAEPIPGDEEASRFYVYHRTGRPCLRCGTPIAEETLQGRRNFWCPNCQR